MKRVWIFLVAAIVALGLAGCTRHNACGGGPVRTLFGCHRGTCATCPEQCQNCQICPQCQGHGCALCKGCGKRLIAEPADPGPAAAQVAYPYYTVRGPRDYFTANPPSIGP